MAKVATLKQESRVGLGADRELLFSSEALYSSRSWVWWLIPVTPALWKAEAKGLQFDPASK